MSGQRRGKGHLLDVLFTLALFCMFAGSLLTVVLLGADVYRRTADGMQRNFELRTSLAYVSEKIRQNDTDGAVRVGDLDGNEALILEQRVQGAIYRTYIYHCGGALREIFAGEDAVVAPESGQKIAEIADFSVQEVSGGLFLISCTDADGEQAAVFAGVRCG